MLEVVATDLVNRHGFSAVARRDVTVHVAGARETPGQAPRLRLQAGRGVRRDRAESYGLFVLDPLDRSSVGASEAIVGRLLDVLKQLL